MKRSGNEPFQGPKRTSESTWRKPLAWNRKALESGTRLRVFTCSMSDFFHEGADSWRDAAWRVIKSCEHLDWLILTKRPDRILGNLPSDWLQGYSNVWLGVTVESQQHVQRVDSLIAVPAAIRFVSAEPLLGAIEFGEHRLGKLDWIITGCEQAGKEKRRAMSSDWVRKIRDQCDESNVKFFHKQYYVENQLIYDGKVDGARRQEWPGTHPLAQII